MAVSISLLCLWALLSSNLVSQVSGQRLKEGGSINKSLVSLGTVIKQLGESGFRAETEGGWQYQ